MFSKFMQMKIGEKSARVLKAQRLLRKAGSAIQETGEFSLGMVSAVKAFQKKNGLKETGVIDIRTWNKLEELGKPAKKTARKEKKA